MTDSQESIKIARTRQEILRVMAQNGPSPEKTAAALDYYGLKFKGFVAKLLKREGLDG